jgi:hypothetical protein
VKRTGSLLGPIIKRLGIEDGVRLIRIKNDWHKLFDRPLAIHMSPSRLSEGELLLNVDSPMWIQQLSYYKREIINKLSFYGVRDVRFRIGKIVSKKEGRSAGPLTEISSEDRIFISGLVSGISDGELKEAVKGAAEKSLRRKK